MRAPVPDLLVQPTAISEPAVQPVELAIQPTTVELAIQPTTTVGPVRYPLFPSEEPPN
jgi:hypothetical protein